MSILITTTHLIEGRRIERYLGLVSGESILGINILKDFMASFSDIVGGRSQAYEDELRKGKDTAISEMAEQARMMGANAVIGVDLDFESLGKGGGMLMVHASGTAVVLGE
jgi:uncharacterized protein YbjQ (UPF0145 family)